MCSLQATQRKLRKTLNMVKLYIPVRTHFLLSQAVQGSGNMCPV